MFCNNIIGTCPPGYTYNASTESCDPCGFGTYKDSSRPGKCEKCTEGFHTRTRGATICEGVHVCACVCMCARVCVCACVRACVCVLCGCGSVYEVRQSSTFIMCTCSLM